MPEITIGNKIDLRLRDVFPLEERDFNPWLSRNLNRLDEHIGSLLQLVQLEAPVGSLWTDILLKDNKTGKNAIIECQYGTSNHDHVGKIFTYGSHYCAGIRILICEVLKEEHRLALFNLQEQSDCLYFVFEVSCYKIDNSNPYVDFNPVLFPDDEKITKYFGTSESSDGNFDAIFNLVRAKLLQNRTFESVRTILPGRNYFVSTCINGIEFNAKITPGKLHTFLYINTRDKSKNKAIFDNLYEQKEVIERELGCSLEWKRKDDLKSSEIILSRNYIGNNQEEIANIFAQDLEVFKRIFGQII